jgi:predicted HicB family RNase H-like nuclease
MSKKQKLLKKFLETPPKKDLTFEELESLLGSCGYTKVEGSGSAVKFYHPQKDVLINLHKPHPSKILKVYLVRQIQVRLKETAMANTIEYKGYIGSIEYSPQDKCFFGKLEMIDDLVTFEADNAQELENNFRNAVDEYLETCKALGREPQKVYKGVFNVRIEPELHKKVYQEALKAGLSLNNFVRQSLSKAVEV